MNKVLLSSGYFYKLDLKQWRFKQPYPPLGTLQAASVLRDSEFDVSVFDVGLKDRPSEIKIVVEKERPTYFVIYDDGFNYLTKMCLTVMREAVFEMTTLAKQLGCVVVINSSDSTDHYEKYFQHGVDFVVRGEGEETLKDLLLCLERNENPFKINGIAFRQDSHSVVTPARSVLRDLDSLPLPAWDLIDLSPYETIWRKHHGYFSLNIATTRGCPFKCNWCAKPIYGNRYNSRSPEHVMTEIELLLQKFKPDHFWMCDDIFGLKPTWINQFSQLVIQKKLVFHYKIQSRVDLLLEDDTINALADSGCETVWVGAESGSQKILDAMDKGTTVEQIKKARTLLKQKGIRTAFFLQFGYLGETKTDIDATLKMVLDLMPEELGISVSYPLPGTKFYERVKGMLTEKQNWSDSDDLAMMFHSTYPPSFYKVLHRYVHNRYRIQRGKNLIKNFKSKKFIGSARELASMVYNIPLALYHQHQLRKISNAYAQS